MKAAVWHGPRDVRVEEVEDPKIQEATDAVIKVTSSAICGSDLHRYEILSPFMPLVTDDADPLGTKDLASHKIGIDEVPETYEKFQKKEDGAIKFVIQP